MRFGKFALAALFVFAASAVPAQVVVTLNAPGVQASTVSGITTENFESFTPGIYTTLNSAIGTYASPGLAVVPANQFGGAGGAGNYFAIGQQSGQPTATLTLNMGDQGYFGFWFSAGDVGNSVQLYENSTLLYTLNTTNLIAFINTQPNASQYFGNPNNGANPSQPYAYVNFFGTNGTVFNTVVFNQNNGGGFESDNQSIGPASPVMGTPVTPEPGFLALLAGMGTVGTGFMRRHRNARKAV